MRGGLYTSHAGPHGLSAKTFEHPADGCVCEQAGENGGRLELARASPVGGTISSAQRKPDRNQQLRCGAGGERSLPPGVPVYFHLGSGRRAPGVRRGLRNKHSVQLGISGNLQRQRRRLAVLPPGIAGAVQFQLDEFQISADSIGERRHTDLGSLGHQRGASRIPRGTIHQHLRLEFERRERRIDRNAKFLLGIFSAVQHNGAAGIGGANVRRQWQSPGMEIQRDAQRFEQPRIYGRLKCGHACKQLRIRAVLRSDRGPEPGYRSDQDEPGGGVVQTL